MEFNDVAQLCYDVADDTGWHDNAFNFTARIGNIHSEIAEAFDAYRKGGQDTKKKWYTRTSRQSSTVDDEDGKYEIRHIYTSEVVNTNHLITLLGQKPPKPEGVSIELADAMIWILDMAKIMDIDMEAAIIEKLDYNRHREYRHGNLPF